MIALHTGAFTCVNIGACFMHNGFIDGLAQIKRDLVPAVDDSLYPTVIV